MPDAALTAQLYLRRGAAYHQKSGSGGILHDEEAALETI
jgi:hypothetical protein